MVLEAVSDRINGEVPDADELNELKDALVALLNTSGLPSSSLDWTSFEAQGNINMAGFSLHNLGSSFGELHVNAAKSLATAVSEANAAGGGDIVVDSGVAAQVPSSGLVVSADNVSIRCQGGGSISFANLAVAGAGLTVTGDNFKFIGNSCSCEGDGTNLTYAVYLNGVVGARVALNLWDGMTAENSVYANAVQASYVVSNVFSDSDKTFLLFEGGEGITYDGNHGHALQANGVLIKAATSAAARNVSISGNTGYKDSAGTAIIDVEGAASPESTKWAILANRLYSPGNTAMSVGNIFDSVIGDNVVDGDVHVYGVERGKVRDNEVSETFTLEDIEGSTKVYGNRADNYSFPGTEATMHFDNNHSVQALSSPSCASFIGNTSDSSIGVSTGTDVYHSNYAGSSDPVSSRQTFTNGINIVGLHDFYGKAASTGTNDQITATVLGFEDFVKGEVKEIDFVFGLTSATGTLTVTVNGVSLGVPAITDVTNPYLATLKIVSVSSTEFRWTWRCESETEVHYDTGTITAGDATALYAASSFNVVVSHLNMDNTNNKFGIVVKGANV